jgi:hypothetical protein
MSFAVMSSSTSSAAAFLAQAVPWPIEGQKWWINIHHARVLTDDKGQPCKDKKGKLLKAFPGRACTTVHEAVKHIEWLNSLDEFAGKDIYVCMSAQSEAEEKINATGRKFYAAKRDANNAVAFQGLWIDVDVKPGDPAKGYPDTATAASEFGRIRRALGLPVPTMLVASGTGGFHAHWSFAEAVTIDIWEPLAFALVAGFVSHGFKGDTGCTIDAARLLRVPDTFNMKLVEAGTGPKLPVRLLTPPGNRYIPSVFENALAAFKGMAPPRKQSVASLLAALPGSPSPLLAASTASPSSLVAGIEAPSAPLVPVADLAAACPFVLRSLQTGGASNPNPLWMVTCRMAIFLKEGDTAAHWMAQGYPSYQYAETQAMIERVRDEHAARDLGWPRCDNIRGQGAPECATCPHFDKHKSPFNFAAAQAQVDPPKADGAASVPGAVVAPLPDGYSYTNMMQVEETITDDEGNQHKEIVVEFPLLEPWMQEHPASFNFTTITAGSAGTVDAFRRQIRLPMGLLQDKSALVKSCAEQHMVFPIHQAPAFSRFIVSWIEQLRRDRQKVVQSVPFGWYKPDGKIKGFIYSRQVWTPKTPLPASNPDPVLERQYQPVGELSPWTRAAKMITDQERPELNAILASAFGAPLVALVGQTGLLMSTYSPESGIGKSTTMRIAQAVWGNPVKAVQSLSDTQNSVIKKVGDLKNLPMYWDELKTNVDTERFVAIAFQLAQGKEKSRMASDTTYREPGTWETLMVSTSNDSIVGAVARHTKTTGAGLARIFEFPVRPGTKGQIEVASAQQIVAAVNDNYGQAGLLYAQFLGANFEQVMVEVDDKLHEIERSLHATAEERFWLSLVVVILMGAHYGNKLGLTEIDEAGLYKFMIEKFEMQRGDRQQSPVDLSNTNSLMGVLTRYLNVKRPRHTLVTNRIWTQSTAPPVPPSPLAIALKSDVKMLQELQVQIGQDTKQIRLLRQPLIDWLYENGYSPKVVLDYLANNYGVVQTRGRLLVGINGLTTFREQVLDIDGSRPEFQQFLEM